MYSMGSGLLSPRPAALAPLTFGSPRARMKPIRLGGEGENDLLPSTRSGSRSPCPTARGEVENDLMLFIRSGFPGSLSPRPTALNQLI